MELRPKIIAMPCSDYTLLVREFYNDSMLIAFKDDVQEQHFYLNQENLSWFDTHYQLVSFRAEFKNEFGF